MITRRSAFAVFAAALATPFVAASVAHAQAPAGALPSNTTPGNSEGTPAGGTGNISNTRVTPVAHTTRRRRRHHRRVKAQ